jgi:hypothetical protein
MLTRQPLTETEKELRYTTDIKLSRIVVVCMLVCMIITGLNLTECI